MNLNDWNDDFNQLSNHRLSNLSMNFDDSEEPRLAINLESDDQKLSARDDLGINANDVLCGRGKTSFNHVGNRRFRHIISESIDDYNNAGSRKAKSAVVKKVHDSIRATGGRFLKMDSSERSWVELSQQRSLEKVSHAIRDATTTNENMKKKKQKVHSTIAQVAAHVTSRFPSVQLEGRIGGSVDGDDHEEGTGTGADRFAFTSTMDSSGGTNISNNNYNNSNAGGENLLLPSMPPLPGSHAAQADARMPFGVSSPAPELTSSLSSAAAAMSSSMSASAITASTPLHQSNILTMPQLGGVGAGRAPSHEHLLFPPAHPPLSPQRRPEDPPAHHHRDDDFVDFINEVLGPVSPTDLDTDPLKKLEKKKRDDGN